MRSAAPSEVAEGSSEGLVSAYSADSCSKELFKDSSLEVVGSGKDNLRERVEWTIEACTELVKELERDELSVLIMLWSSAALTRSSSGSSSPAGEGARTSCSPSSVVKTKSVGWPVPGSGVSSALSSINPSHPSTTSSLELARLLNECLENGRPSASSRSLS